MEPLGSHFRLVLRSFGKAQRGSDGISHDFQFGILWTAKTDGGWPPRSSFCFPEARGAERGLPSVVWGFGLGARRTDSTGEDRFGPVWPPVS